MRAAFLGMACAVCLVLSACGDDGGGAAPGTERGPCRVDGTCDPGLVCLSDLCVRPTDVDGGDAADAGPDASLSAEAQFTDHVAPVYAARCATCHETGTQGAPAFGSSLSSFEAYDSPRGQLLDCTLTQSLLFTKGPHADAEIFTTQELAGVRGFLDAWAVETPSCSATAGLRPGTGSYIFEAGDYLLDLSTLGPGLQDSSITFTVSVEVGGLLLSNVQLVAGAQGLTAIGPRFETCPADTHTPDPTDGFRGRFDLSANQTMTLGSGMLSLPGAVLGDRFGLHFDALLPPAGSLGIPVDQGGACVQ